MFHAPTGAGLPHIVTMLDDIAATPKQLAAHLGIKESTLATYKRNGNAPRAVMLALFWETQWGRSYAYAEAHNFGLVHQQVAAGLQSHQARMAGIIWRLETELERDQGGRPANLPVFAVG